MFYAIVSLGDKLFVREVSPKQPDNSALDEWDGPVDVFVVEGETAKEAAADLCERSQKVVLYLDPL